MNKAERLAQFLEWVADEGGTALQPGDLRLIAVALLEESGGGRVTESHILQASDRHAGVGGDRAVAKVHEVGELFMRFEESLRLAGTPAPAPRGPMGTSRPRGGPGDAPLPLPRARMSGTGEVPADVGMPLRPPRGESALPAGEVEPPKVTFASQAQPRSSPPPATGTPAPSPSSARPAAPSGPPAPLLRRGGKKGKSAAGVDFRCPKCATMVTASPEGLCPRCGSPAPQMLDMPARDAPVSLGARRVSPLLVGVVLAVAVVASIVIVRLATRQRVEALPGRPMAAGEVDLDYLSIRATFPAGWNDLDDASATPITEEIDARSLRFVRRGAELILVVARDIPLPEAAQEVITDDELRMVIDELAANVEAATGHTLTLEPESCEVVAAGMTRTARCAGDSGTEQGVIYVWLIGERLGVAYLFGSLPRASMYALGDDLVAGIDDALPEAAAAEDGEGEGDDGEAANPADVDAGAAP